MDVTTILSPTEDVNFAETARLASLYERPDFVKQADSERLRPRVTAANGCADPQNLRYFCGNKAACWLSALFFTEKRSSLDSKLASQIEQRLQRLVNYHGISDEYNSILQRHAELHKEAELKDSDYAYVWVDDRTGDVTRKCPMRSAMETKTAAEYLHEYRDIFPYFIRNTMAHKILQKAAAFGASLGELSLFVERQAGRGTCDPVKVAKMLRDRACLTTDPVAKRGMDKLAAMVADTPQLYLQSSLTEELASMVDDFDRKIGLAGRYESSRMPRPEDVIFETTFREARADFEKVCRLSTGLVYNKQDFTQLSPQDLTELFGGGFVSDCLTGFDIDPEKMAEQAAVLPVHDAEAFAKLLEQNGIHPALVEKGAAVRFSPNQLSAMAAAY